MASDIAFGPNPDAKAFLERNAAGKKIAMFITHKALEDSLDIAGWIAKCREAAAGTNIVGIFDCQGEVSDEVINFLLKSDEPRMKAFGEQGPSTKGQPDESRLERARAFAKDVCGRA